LIDKMAQEVDRYLLMIPDRPHVLEADLLPPVRARDAEGVARVIQAHLEEVEAQVVARVRELMADGHLAYEPATRRRRSTARRAPSRPKLVAPLAG
jgi:hypothetical protein